MLHFAPISGNNLNFEKQVIASRCPLIIVTLMNGSLLSKFLQKIEKISGHMDVSIP